MRRTLFLSLWLLASGASAQTITGTENVPFDHGTVIDIGGTGFGAKAAAPPKIWDDFESGSSGALISTSGTWTIISDNPNETKPQYSNSRAYSGSLSLVNIVPVDTPTTGGRDVAAFSGMNIGASDKFFFSFWFNQTWSGPDTDGVNSRQHKYMRLTDGPGDSDTKPEIVLSWNRNGFHWLATDEVGNFTFCDNQTSYMGHPSTGTWYNMTVRGQMSSGGGSCNGIIHIEYGFSTTEDRSDWNWLTSDTFGFDEIWLGGYSDGNESIQYYYFDDAYADNSWARVELGDSPTYSSCTVRQMQIPTVWAATQISITVNTGAFGSGDSAWLYVFDENNNRSNGYPVTIGQSGGGISPVALTAPTNLQVNGGN